MWINVHKFLLIYDSLGSCKIWGFDVNEKSFDALIPIRWISTDKNSWYFLPQIMKSRNTAWGKSPFDRIVICIALGILSKLAYWGIKSMTIDHFFCHYTQNSIVKHSIYAMVLYKPWKKLKWFCFWFWFSVLQTHHFSRCSRTAPSKFSQQTSKNTLSVQWIFRMPGV